MKLLAAVLLLTACTTPCEPQDIAILDSGWWYVTLSDGRKCIALPYQEPETDTTPEAIALCRSAP